MFSLGIIADTHIPDRREGLPPQALEVFRQSQVRAIMHAGDVSVPSVLEQLAELAPVYAVRGNRDFLYLPQLPLSRLLEFEGVTFALAHGHGGWRSYVVDRLYITAYGLKPARFKRRMWQAFPEARVIVFGHLHLPILEWQDGRLLINPGSACCPDENAPGPSVALVHLGTSGQVEGEIVYLDETGD